MRFAAGPGGRQLGQPGERQEALGNLRLGGKEPLATQPDPLYQAAHKDVRTALLKCRRRGAVEL